MGNAGRKLYVGPDVATSIRSRQGSAGFHMSKPMRIPTFLAMAVLLAGCSLFSTTNSWTKAGASEEQAAADLRSCKQVASAEQATDAKIDQDTSAVMND